MEEPVNLFAIGTAGCGKSTFTAAFHRWFHEKGLDAVTVNLDPGSEDVPYAPDVDIREWIVLSDVMAQYQLGPNGAQVLAADLLALRMGEVKAILEQFRPQYYVFDTPGQTELFVFRESGRITMDLLGRDRSAIAFLIDPFLARTATAFVSQLLLSATTQFRFQVPVINVLSKSDLMKDEDRERILMWASDLDTLEAALFDETADMMNQLNTDIFRAIEGMGTFTNLVPVSSETGEGMEDVYAVVQDAFSGGEDLSPD